ncbi:hypothetical protein Poly59_39200 [Rubripirellula reticaptiva]|uniref:Uncharacterized protein n=1 Tax=Rubripirellula reticaptiva TaxID=2528013 RepID=A0A5C6ENX5_9BACT|nr:hypothetical protein Poly59_39200 [Rubripirellula reticaptiva]
MPYVSGECERFTNAGISARKPLSISHCSLQIRCDAVPGILPHSDYKFWTRKFILLSVCVKTLWVKTGIFVTIPAQLQ